MKAIIMAGGEGTRLRPVSMNCPKPMTELLDRPVLEYILRLLKKNGVTEACLTLKYLPQMIMDYFGSGEAFGLRLDYRVEQDALGTAGGVLNCVDFIGDEDFLVLSGDCVCDFNLQALMDFHREKKAEATLALYSHNTPLEYGLVITDDDGRVERFLEKPGWDHVLTDRINTGIYILSPSVLAEIPKNKPYDFGRELFPRFLENNRALFGCGMEGYWCDIGSSSAYLQCVMDILDGKVKGMELEAVRNGMFAAAPLPDGVELVPPVYIGRGAVIDRGAKLGPYAVVGSGSVVASRAQVRYSVINGAVVGEDASLTGAVVCRNASIGRGSVLSEGSVVGERTLVGENCLLHASAKLWPNRQIPAGCVVSDSVSFGMLKSGVTFSKPGIISGAYGTVLTAEDAMKLGEASAKFKRVGVGWSGGEAARVLAEAFGAGVCMDGGDLVRYDAGFAACASYAGALLGLPLTIFIEESEGNVTLTFFGKNGDNLTREMERKLEMSTAPAQRDSQHRTGRATDVRGIPEAYIAAAVREAGFGAGILEQFEVAVARRGTENRTLKSALELIGVNVSDRASGIIKFDVKKGGRLLEAVDEEGYRLMPEQLFMITAFVELEYGTKTMTVPYDAPTTLEKLAQAYGAEILRSGRDGARAQAIVESQRRLKDGVFAGVRLCAYLAERKEKLSDLRRKLPKFNSVTREVTLKGDRGAVMRMLLKNSSGVSRETASGLRLDTGLGCVTISPLRERSALKIHTESFSEETAEELCAEFEKRAQQADQT